MWLLLLDWFPESNRMGDHYIPRLLLRRFCASQTRSGQAMVFQFQRGNPPPKAPFPVDRVAAERGFYDHPSGANLDHRGMHDHEKQTGKVLAAIESGASPEDYRKDLAIVFSVMMARTRAIRDEWTHMVETLLDQAHRAMASPTWNQAIQSGLRENCEATVRACLEGCTQETRAQIEFVLSQPGGIQFLQEHFVNMDLSSAASSWMSKLRSHLDPSLIMKKGQVDALLRVFHKQAVSWHENVRFEVIRTPEDSERVILGDVCVVALGDDGSFANPTKFGRSCKARFLPIGPRLVLSAVATSESSPRVSASDLNHASATLSREFFFSAGSGHHEAALLGLLGTAPASVSCAEIREMTQKAIGTFRFSQEKK